MTKNIPKAREITTHRVNGLNELLRVLALDAPGSGGACHEYVILIPVEAHDEMCYKHNPPSFKDADYWNISVRPTAPGEQAGVGLRISADTSVTGEPRLAVIEDFDTTDGDPIQSRAYYNVVSLSFQNGPIKEHGVNGLSQEALIAVLIDRLEGFQSGQFKCHDNQVALDSLQNARLWLHKRTMDRVARDVEGTTAV